MSLPLNSRPQLSEEVATHIRDLIMAGTVRPGERLRLEELAAKLGVSITPVREALLILRSEDMVELQPRRGYVVAPLSRQDIEDVFSLQANLAGELAARASRRTTENQLLQLNDLQAALREAAGEARLQELERLEFAFHRVINLVTESRKLARFLYTATRYTPHRFYASDPAWRANMLSDHQALLDALAARDAQAARAAMSRHFTDGAERLLKHLDDIGMWDKRPAQ
ncbi:GntR family transcriptional regulator [Rhizocola hellebori]|uniref:GntR family transcriptional regulator n=1 Tax=Rhizocola hellebori TaxID=1392758 RepID=A0A8J3VE53_9ACTN|nr:GntR family transcriptional regulator [Rhizocola hellebori]GIH03011.1 GntR family transcriptional regulator [Rhizocola hellebori]